MSDPTRKIATAYGVSDGKNQFAARWTFYIAKDGRIAFIDKKVNVTTHGADVAAKLQELKVAKKEPKKDEPAK